MLISSENHCISRALSFSFKASNKEAEYEAMIVGLKLARELQVDVISIYSDSKLVVGQVLGEFQARDERMATYLKIVKRELEKFSKYEVVHVIRAENTNVDALARLATSKDSELLRFILVEVILEPSLLRKEEVVVVNHEPLWMDDIIAYLEHERLPQHRDWARRVKYDTE